MGCPTVPQSLLAPWTRKHDKPGTLFEPQAPVIFYPNKLEDLICICANRPADNRLHAAGSHWSLSTAAVSDHSFVETHDWNDLPPANARTFHQVMGRTLFDVVPGCLADEFLADLNARSTAANGASEYFVHFESGKRIYQLYSELDVGDNLNPESLCTLMQQRFNNNFFTGSWAIHTLGGAGGQTVVGALSTGTHGGDFDRPPLADFVVALHLVADGGKHFWIERSHRDQVPFTDEKKLRAFYGQNKFGGPGNFEVIYDDAVFRAALIQVGRFGAVYSAVLRVVPQYGLQQEVSADQWENVRNQLGPGAIPPLQRPLFTNALTMPSGAVFPQRFLQIAINPIPVVNGTAHTCAITKRWTLPLDQVLPMSPLPAPNWTTFAVAGRPERVGDIQQPNPDPLLNAPFFSAAGLNVAFSASQSFNLFDWACKDPNFMQGVVSAIFPEIANFIANNTLAVGGALAAAAALGALETLAPFLPLLLLILALLAAFLTGAGPNTTGQALNDLRNALLGDPALRPAGIWVWRAIANAAFQSQALPDPKTYSAISYAVMDTNNYQDVSCNVNVRSVEVFFDVTDPALTAFVDRLLQFEIDQEFASGSSVAGYVSLRFCLGSTATIAPELFPLTCCVECAGLADEAGSAAFVNFAVTLALDPNINGILHWGQQNSSTQSDIEFRFGDSPASPAGPLHDWRSVLSQLTDNGRLDGFSSQFTRDTGLEIVQPLITSFKISTAPSAAHPACTVSWVCHNNPSGTVVSLEIVPPAGPGTLAAGLPLDGNHTFNANGPGVYVLKLQVSLDRNGVTRKAKQDLNVPGV